MEVEPFWPHVPLSSLSRVTPPPPAICSEYELNRLQILTYRTFKSHIFLYLSDVLIEDSVVLVPLHNLQYVRVMPLSPSFFLLTRASELSDPCLPLLIYHHVITGMCL